MAAATESLNQSGIAYTGGGQGAAAPCQYLDWDSSFFGCRIGRATVTKLNEQSAKAMLGWCRDNRIDCIYFLADSDDAKTVSLAEDNGFRLVDIRITHERLLADTAPLDSTTWGDKTNEFLIRPHIPQDIPHLRVIARSAHDNTRFFYDPNFLVTQSQLLYETWIEKSCNGFADAVFVAEYERQAVGYVSCHLPDGTGGEIGLVGVRADLRGRRAGSALVNEAMRWFIVKGADKVSVVTQGRNYSAQRLYQRSGFVTRSVQLWYHRWFSNERPAGL